MNTLFLLSFLVFSMPCVNVKAKNFYTPLHQGYGFACVAEHLKQTGNYYCDSYGKVRCLPGWTESYHLCRKPVCEVNGQTCVNGNCTKPYTCDCEVGWWGQFCEKCVTLPGCVNGYCNRSLECVCKEGWKGMLCDKPSCPDCEHGDCVMPGMCACHPGWSGPDCTICEPRLDCKYGRCVDEPFECKCYSKYDGVSCDKPQCKEGCHPVHGYCHVPETCYCKPGWKGENCTECEPYWNCKNGKCNDNPWECICDPGYTGPDCNGNGNEDGNWGTWSEWSDCSVSCGEGVKKRTRKCDDPPPSGNGTYCSHDGSSCEDIMTCTGDGDTSLCPRTTEPPSATTITPSTSTKKNKYIHNSHLFSGDHDQIFVRPHKRPLHPLKL